MDLDFDSSLIFVGNDQMLKWKIYQRFKRYSESATYDAIEEEYFGEVGIDLKIDENKVNLKNCKFICIDDFQDIMSEFNLKRNTLFSKHIEYLETDFDISRQMLNIDEEIIKLESILDEKTMEWSDTFSLHVNSLTFKELINKQLNFNFQFQNQEVPNYTINIKEYLDELLKLIEFQILRTGIEVWIVLFNPENLMGSESFTYLLAELRKIYKESKLLKTVIFHNHYTIDYEIDDISNFVICAEDTYMFPDYYVLRNSIERFYPIPMKFSDRELLEKINQVVHYLGAKSSKHVRLTPKNMVLLKVLSDLIECRFQFETSEEEMSQLEWDYLTRIDI